MNEEPTKNLTDRRSFEDRIFARFDSVDARFDSVDAKFDSVEARLQNLESRAYDTKPIWERALEEIMATREEVGELNKRVGVLETNYGAITKDFEEFKSEMVRQLTRRLDLVLKALVDNRDEMAFTRDELAAAEKRITQLESQLA